MKNGLLAIGALVVGALVFFWIRSSDSSSKAETTSAAKQGEQETNSSARRPPPPRRMAGDSDDPAAPKRYSGNGDPSATTARSYVRDDGTEVRDHRASAPEPNLDRRATLPRALSKVQPETLRAVRLALRPQMMKCIDAHAPDAEDDSKAQAVLTVSITGEQLKVDKLDFQTSGLAAETEANLEQCVSGVMLGHEQTIAGSPDVAKHVMTFPYDL